MYKKYAKSYKDNFARPGKALAVIPVKPQPKLNERQKDQVKKLFNRRTELKYHSKEFLGQAFYSGAGVYLTDLTAITQGQTDTSRIGDKALLSRIEYSFTLFAQSTTISHTIRVMFFQYKPNDAAVLTAIDAIVDNGPAGVIDPWSPYDHDFKSDYTILSDKIYQSNPNQSNVISTGLRRLSVKRANKEITYVAGATFGGHHIYMAVWSNSLVANPATITGRTRVFFRDA